MPGDLRTTWNDMAARFNDWGPPLRPCAEDIRVMQKMAANWHRASRREKTTVFLCGVTPEIVTMRWPFPIELIGMDQAEGMVRAVWPGDLPGVRRGVVGNWLESGLRTGSQDLVIGDDLFHGIGKYPVDLLDHPFLDEGVLCVSRLVRRLCMDMDKIELP